MEKNLRQRNDWEQMLESLSINARDNDDSSASSNEYSDKESNLIDEASSDVDYVTSIMEDYDQLIKSQKKFSCLKIIIDLPLYPPSEKIKIAKNLNFSTKSLYDNNTEVIRKFLTDSKLNKDNIHFVYKMLLEIEDISCMLEYVPLAQKDVKLNRIGMGREYWISLKDCPNIQDVVTPLIDEVVLVPKASSALSEVVPLKYQTDLLLKHEHEGKDCNDLLRRRTATVQQISKDRAYFRFSKHDRLTAREVGLLSSKKYDIIFRSRRYPLRYQHHAIELLSVNHGIREYLLPNRITSTTIEKPLLLNSPLLNSKSNLFNTTVASNPEQLMAIHHITETPDLNVPFIIFGPPGTGKTTVIVESILQLRFRYPKSRILVSAGSNSACDTIALRICKHFKSDSRLKGLTNPLLRIYSKSIVEKGIKTIDPVLQKYSNCEYGVHEYPSVVEIHQYGIIVATLCTVGKLVTAHVGYSNLFTHIFLDEAGASTVPETLVGIMGIKTHSSCRVILSGDHKQLGPIIKSEQAAQLGLEQSLMEHLLKFECYAVDDNFNYDCTLQARLRRNYRSHPEIVRLYNHLYYNDELIAEAKGEDVNLAAKWCKLPNPNFPIMFQAVHGVTKKSKISPSSFNKLEVDVLMWFLRRLLNDGINGEKVKQSDIGIITPYKLQNRLIQNRLGQRGWWSIETGSVETFQGREKQIIIASLVRSFSGLGFVRSPKRLNVLLSRPKSLLILIGNPLTLRRHSDFAFVMDECQKHGTFLRGKKRKF